MNIIYVQNCNIPFDTIKKGDCFIWKETPYMKVYHSYSDIELNAVNLENGNAMFFDPTEPVIPTYAELYVTTTEGESNENI